MPMFRGNKSTDTQRVYSVAGIGGPGPSYVRGIISELAIQKQLRLLLAAGWIDNNISLALRQQPLKLPNIANLTPPRELLTEGQGFTGDWARAEAARSDWLHLPKYVVEQEAAAIYRQDVRSPFFVDVASPAGGHPELFKEFLSLQHTAAPNGNALALFTLPNSMSQFHNIADHPTWVPELKAAGSIEAAVGINNLTKLALTFGRPKMDECVIKTCAALLGANQTFPNFPCAADIIHNLSRYTPCWLGMSFGLGGLTSTKEITLSQVSRQFDQQAPLRGLVAHPKSVVITVKEATKTAIGDANWRTLADGPNKDLPAYLLIRLPLRLGRPADLALWREVIAQVENWLQEEYPFLTAVWVQGDGAQNPTLRPVPYPMMVSCIYPVTEEIPSDIQHICNHPSVAPRVEELPPPAPIYEDVTPRAAAFTPPPVAELTPGTNHT